MIAANAGRRGLGRCARREVLVSALASLSTCQCERLDVYAVTANTPSEPQPSSDDASPSESNASIASSSSDNPSNGTSQQSDATAERVTETAQGASSSIAVSSETTPCDGLVVQPGDINVTVAVGSLERTYVLHVPPKYDGLDPAPLIIDFHGAGGSGRDQLVTSPYPPVTDADGVIMAFPDGVNGPIGTAWNVGPCCVPGVDDLAFVDAMVADIQSRVCVDTQRVYAVGVLTGGGMAHYLACERAEVFAAVSPAAFDLAEETVVGCQPSLPVGVVAFRGTADAKVPYEGGSSMLVPNMTVTFLGAEQSFRRWAEIDGCTGEPSAPDAEGCRVFDQCQGSVEVVLCTKEDGPAEPGDPRIAWPILARHHR